jgi:lipopolysaccharide heptosyltransferase II
LNTDSIDVRRILVIRLGQIGDIILTAPLIRALRKRFPNAEISMLTRAKLTLLPNAIPGLDKTYKCPRIFFSLLDVRHKLRAVGFDTVIDLQNNLKSRRYAHVISPKRLFRFHRWRNPRWFFINLPFLRSNITKPGQIPIQYLQVASDLGLEDDGLGINLRVKEEWRSKAQNLLDDFWDQHKMESDDKLLIIAPGASRRTKIWQMENWVEFLKLAFENGYRRQVLIGAGWSDKKLCKKIAGMVNYPMLMAAGKTNIEESIGLISLADKFVSSDSGPMHIAAGVGTPLVAIFGPTVEEFGFTPFRCRSEIAQVDGLSCRPCHPHGPKKCPRGHFKCMTEITPEQVMSKVELLDNEIATIESN